MLLSLLAVVRSLQQIAKAAHLSSERGFLIPTGRKCNRWLRVADETAPGSRRWQKPSRYVAGLSEQDYVPLKCPRSGKVVYVHVLTTSVRKLYRCQIVRHSLDAPLAQARLGF